MCSYNKIGGTYSCENNATLNTDLRERLGFKGWVMSDWTATHSTSILEGLDQQMPGSSHFNQRTLAASKYSAAVDRSTERILTPLFQVGVFDTANPNSIKNNVSTPASMAVARALCENATVLLKNAGGLLPLTAATVKKLVLVGSDALTPTTGGGGSGSVSPSYVPSPLAAIRGRFGAAAGAGAPGVVEQYSDAAAGAAAAATADAAVVFVSVKSSEGFDRTSLGYGDAQDAMVAAVAAANPRTVVVAVAPGMVLMPWAGQVASILMPFMPVSGQR